MGEGGTVRQERATEARRLRDKGWTGSEIAYLLDISESYVWALLSDPDGSKDKARKRSYSGACEVCGAPTDGSNGAPKSPKLCLVHERERVHDERHWTPERVLAGMRRLAKDVAPRRPVATDVLKEIPKGEDGIGIYPPWRVIRRELGSWGNAMEAIGFDRPRRGIRTPEGQARMVAANKRKRGARL